MKYLMTWIILLAFIVALWAWQRLTRSRLIEIRSHR